MTPYYGLNRQKNPYFYYYCSRHNHLGNQGCQMRPVPAQPLEDAVVSRLIQLSGDRNLVAGMVENAASESSARLSSLSQTRSNLARHREDVQRKLGALVESIADRKTGIKSISRKIIELEEQKEQLDDEILSLEMQIEESKKKAVSAGALQGALTTFRELHQEATLEERRELMRLHINQLVWTPEEIRLALFGNPTPGNAVTKVQPEKTFGSPYGIRTRVADVRGRRPRPLDERAKRPKWSNKNKPPLAGCQH